MTKSFYTFEMARKYFKEMIAEGKVVEFMWISGNKKFKVVVK